MSALDELPGEPVMWVLIVSELAVFGLALAAMLVLRVSDPAGFAEAQSLLHRTAAGLNTVVLVSSGLLAALATRARRIETMRWQLTGAVALGAVFLVVKTWEYLDLMAQGIGFETHPLFMFYFGLTGFHAAHVVFGMGVLALVAMRGRRAEVEAGAQFWHMVDLIWVILFPVVYLLR